MERNNTTIFEVSPIFKFDCCGLVYPAKNSNVFGANEHYFIAVVLEEHIDVRKRVT